MVYGLCSYIMSGLGHLLLGEARKVWMVYLLGIPTTFVAGAFAYGVACLLIRREPKRPSIDAVSRGRLLVRHHQLGGMVATLAAASSIVAMFTRAVPGPEAWVWRGADALLLTAGTWGLWRRQPHATLFVAVYFILIKLPLWSHFYPQSTLWAGSLMGIFLWRGWLAQMEGLPPRVGAILTARAA